MMQEVQICNPIAKPVTVTRVVSKILSRLMLGIALIMLASCIPVPDPTSLSPITQILIQRDDQSIWILPLNGDRGKQLTPSLPSGNNTVIGSLSPDQQWLAYVQLRDWRGQNADTGKALLLNIKSGQSRILLNQLLPSGFNWLQEHPMSDKDRAVIESQPVWSKDSQRFTLVSAHEGMVGLYLYDLSTDKMRRLASGQTNIAWPQWSPDEIYILYNEIEAFGTGAGANGGALWIVRSDIPDLPRRLSNNDDHFEAIDRWQDNTHVLTYNSSLMGRTNDNVVDIQTGQHVPLSAPTQSEEECLHYTLESNQLSQQPFANQVASLVCNAGFAPQGHWAYSLVDNNAAQTSQLYLIDTESMERILLAQTQSPNAAAFSVQWSPDGQYLSWLSPEAQSTSAQLSDIPKYDLWIMGMNQKAPVLLAQDVSFFSKRYWLSGL